MQEYFTSGEKGGVSMEKARRITVSFPPELEKELVNLRKTDEFCQKSWAEIIRRMIELGLACEKKED